MVKSGHRVKHDFKIQINVTFITSLKINHGLHHQFDALLINRSKY